jgi:hypothetical protein
MEQKFGECKQLAKKLQNKKEQVKLTKGLCSVPMV